VGYRHLILAFNRIHIDWTNVEDCALRFEYMLAEDHARKRPHVDSYEIPG
jgi:hypothetical protein